jgi:hypothetical protein
MSNSNSNYNSEDLNEYSPETRRGILIERRQGQKHLFDNDPVDYPFVDLESEMKIYISRNDFRMPEYDQPLDSFYAHIDYSFDKGKIDEETYQYLRNIRGLKNKLMYPSTAFQLTLQGLIRLTNSINEDPNNIWMYYSDRRIKLIDFVVSVYFNYLREDIRIYEFIQIIIKE